MTTTETVTAVTSVRQTLMQAAKHWTDVSENAWASSSTDPRAAEAHAAAVMASAYPYALAALLGQMAESERENGEPWTAEEAARFLDDLFVNGDTDNLNADVMPKAGV
jgi:hypothetical protein